MPNPSTYGGFCHLLKISLDIPYLKIIDLPKLFVAVASVKKVLKNSITPSQSTLKFDQEQSKIKFYTSYVHKLTILR